MDTELDMGKYSVKKSKKPRAAGSQTSGWTTTAGTSTIPESLISDMNNLKIARGRLERYAAEAGDERYLSQSSNNRLEANTKILREKAITAALDNIKRSMNVDLCFVLDCTGSMSSHISAAKDCIIQVVDYMERTNPSIKIWVGFCGYRDYCDGHKRLETFNFTDSYDQFRRYVRNVQATGGGDVPEDVLGGLNAAITKMNWSHTTRVILHVGDAPPHGRRFTDEQDDYPKGDPSGLTAESVLGKMKSSNILYFFGKITQCTNKMLRIFREIIGEFPVFDLEDVGGNPTSLIAKFFQATCSAISSSVSLTSTLGNNIYELRRKDFDINPIEPNWHSIRQQAGTVAWYKVPKTLADIKNKEYFNQLNTITQKISFKIAPQPFSVGAERYAYFGLNVTGVPAERMVIKEYLDSGKKANSIERYLEAVEVSNIAHFLSLKFNLAATRAGIQKKVKFLHVKFLSITNGTRYYNVEPKISNAEFKRFNVNSGVITEFHSTLEAFAHFTYDFTGGYLLVCDLQGAEFSNHFLLTDPAIHCTDSLRFGRTNLGKRGIEKCFLINHKCGSVCNKLGLKAP
ncbi:11012_t:CDS:1 [Funneliformis geosporum]|uniref:5560_t:CDS:1 n=1 Tax=Funneliformis geosporum TaxID=1117311 RepID=A0A9W4SUP5_9GLOM|nr:11012_t:CDS:1 [Funneliformis geosporum]CAI2182244.1 5560_t:CDS:1 [Funneliformis geosporum]